MGVFIVWIIVFVRIFLELFRGRLVFGGRKSFLSFFSRVLWGKRYNEGRGLGDRIK